MDESLIEAVKEVAVVATMNAAISALKLHLNPKDIDKGKAEYMSKIEVRLESEEKVLVLFQSWRDTVLIGPLYGCFSSSWNAKAVERGVNQFCNSNGAMGSWTIRLAGSPF